MIKKNVFIISKPNNLFSTYSTSSKQELNINNSIYLKSVNWFTLSKNGCIVVPLKGINLEKKRQVFTFIRIY
jgi:hypothetical protein